MLEGQKVVGWRRGSGIVKVKVQIMDGICRPRLIVGLASPVGVQTLVWPDSDSRLPASIDELQRLGPKAGELVDPDLHPRPSAIAQVSPPLRVLGVIATGQHAAAVHDLVSILAINIS